MKNIDIEKAKNFCKIAHSGQFRWDNMTPYYTHPFEVSEIALKIQSKFFKKVNPKIVQIVSLLHDVIEDTRFSKNDLEKEFGYKVSNYVDILSKKNGQSYADYIIQIKKLIIPKIVKIADISHNLLDLDWRKHKNLKQKYEISRLYLLGERDYNKIIEEK